VEASETLCDVVHLTIYVEGNIRTDYSTGKEFNGQRGV